MPIVLIVLLLASIMELRWPAGYFGIDSIGTISAVLSLCLLSVGISVVLAHRLHWSQMESQDQYELALSWWTRWRSIGFYINIGIVLIAIFVFGWARMIRTECVVPNTTRLWPMAELLVPGPYFFLLALNWVVQWWADRTQYRRRRLVKPFVGPVGYWLHNLRQFAIFVCLPVLLTATQYSLTRWLPGTSQEVWYQVALVLGPLLLFLIFPIVLRFVLGWKPLPPGPRRDRFVSMAARLKVRYADILLMPTQGLMANAFVIGFIPQARYVVFTDAILEQMSEADLDAVLGHELGHVRHHHLEFFLGFLILSSIALSSLVALGAAILRSWTDEPWIQEVVTSRMLGVVLLGAMAIYLFVVFGWLSRACERQADLFGSLANSCLDPHCHRHETGTRLSEATLCPTGLRQMAQALEHVALIYGLHTDSPTKPPLRTRLLAWLRAWQHGPIGHRVQYLYSVIDRPALAAMHQRKVWLMRVGLIAVLILCCAAGYFVSLEELDTILGD